MHRVLVAGVAASAAATIYASSLRSHADQALQPVQSVSTAHGLLDRKNAQLRLVQVVFRHGARTPLTDQSHLWKVHEWDVCGCAYEAMPLKLTSAAGGPCPPSPDDEKQVSVRLPGNCHKGELTLLGQKQALDLGLWLRRQYIDGLGFMPASYKEGSLSARTTNFSRTRATLAGVLRGLYPDDTGPVTVVTSGQLDEILYADSRTCPHLAVLMKASAAMVKAKAERQKEHLAELRSQLSAALELPEGYWGRKWQFTDLHDIFVSVKSHGKALPKGVTHDMEEQVDKLATQEFGSFICPSLEDDHGKTVLRLSMGRMLDTLLANMEQTIQITAATATTAAGGRQQGSSSSSSSSSDGDGSSSGSSSSSSSSYSSGMRTEAPPKMMLYSGHDSTIMPLLTALGVDVSRWPPYLSNLVFELWEMNPPQPPPHTKMISSSSSSSSSSTSRSSSSSGGDGRGPQEQRQYEREVAAAGGGGGAVPFVVRVLYNKEPVALVELNGQGASRDIVEFSHFKEQVLAPFMLSQQDHEQACHAGIGHEGPLPTIISMSSASDEVGE